MWHKRKLYVHKGKVKTGRKGRERGGPDYGKEINRPTAILSMAATGICHPVRNTRPVLSSLPISNVHLICRRQEPRVTQEKFNSLINASYFICASVPSTQTHTHTLREQKLNIFWLQHTHFGRENFPNPSVVHCFVQQTTNKIHITSCTEKSRKSFIQLYEKRASKWRQRQRRRRKVEIKIGEPEQEIN